MKNKNSFRFKEGKFILGRPLSYKLYEYWQLCMHSLITLALHPPQSAIAWRVLADCLSLIAMARLPSPSETAWRSWLTQLTTLADNFYGISPTFTILRHIQQKNRFEFYGQEPSWDLRIWNCDVRMPQIREFWRIFVSIWISTSYTFSVSLVQEMGAKTPAPRGRKLRVDAIRS